MVLYPQLFDLKKIGNATGAAYGIIKLTLRPFEANSDLKE
jgi:hypothetical protein